MGRPFRPSPGPNADSVVLAELARLWDQAVHFAGRGRGPVTQQRLSAEAGVPYTTVNSWSTGRFLPRDLDQLAAVGAVLASWAGEEPLDLPGWRRLQDNDRSMRASADQGNEQRDARVWRVDPVQSVRESLIGEKIEEFVGRGHVSTALKSFIERHDRGYFVIEGHPGSGKTSILAEYVRRTGCLAHFNIRSQGITSAARETPPMEVNPMKVPRTFPRSAWRQLRSVRAAVSAVVIAAAVSLLGGASATAATNLVINPGLETLGSNGFPTCWEQSGWGTNNFSFGVTNQAHSGSNAMQVSITSITNGDRKAMMLENPQCAPPVTPTHQYNLCVWYMSNSPNVSVTAFRHDTTAGWQYWMDLKTLTVSGSYQQACVLTPQVPANTDQITWGVSIYGVGTLITDDYSMTDNTSTGGGGCTAGAACTQGSWQVLPFPSPVRAIHAVLLYSGKVLLVAGSGNDPNAFAAGSFTSAVYDPSSGTFQVIPTPNDFFCSGHVQLSDGRVLVLGGNLAYPAADGSHGYEGLNTSYIFNPATNSYQKVNNLNDGHWYPSATELGNGDVISFGGLKADSSGSVTTEYFSSAQQQWLPLSQVHQTWSYWGLYPAMVLMQDGRLFYTGSHVFGNGLPGTGSDIYNYATNTITPISGLQNKDNRDQSMSVLLPPAQSQKVLTLGGGNIVTNPDANRLTDIIDLTQANPAYTPGPLIPTGTLTGGTPEASTQGKMYVSAVILPNGQVFETGGGLHNRADPVYEASMYNPQTNTFTPGMATDPVPRTYHSSAFLLPDGRVMAVGNNPGDGSFDMRISVYSPPYLFNGARPQITSVATNQWSYGATENITTDSPIVSAELIRPEAVTHSSDPNQRYVALPLTVNGSNIGLNVTTNPNIAPPGWYMLFVTNANGIPSVAQWVHLS